MTRAAIVLAGGRSLRMGSEKALLDAGGRTLLEHHLETLSGVAEELILSVAYDGPSAALEECVKRARRKLGRDLRIVSDEVPDAGPLEGVRAALSSCQAAGAWVLAVDAGEVDPALLESLREAGSRDGMLGCVPRWSRGVEPLPAWYARALAGVFEGLLQSSGGALRAPAGLRSVAELDLEAPAVATKLFGRRLESTTLHRRLGALFGSLNTPEAYEAWLAGRRGSRGIDGVSGKADRGRAK